VEIRAENDQITVSLEGVAIARYRTSETWAGYVGLAGDRGTMEYRRITVADMTDEPGCAAYATATMAPNTTVPRALNEQQPRYLAGAMARKAQGTVVMTVIVLKDGSVGPVCVTRSVDADLDVQAVAAAKRWRFQPYVVNGEPTALRVLIEMTFKLR
jgi:TonB family protein